METVYTKEHLKTQLKNAKLWLESSKLEKDGILSPDWLPAKTYGEETRANHLRTVNNRIEHYQKRIIALMLAIGPETTES